MPGAELYGQGLRAVQKPAQEQSKLPLLPSSPEPNISSPAGMTALLAGSQAAFLSLPAYTAPLWW